MFADHMIAQGVPSDKIIREDAAKNTGDNFALTRKLLDKIGIAFKTALVVTKPYMERRALATADVQWPDKQVIVTSPSAKMADYLTQSPKGITDEISIMVGDAQRLKVYPARGFMSEQFIAPEVEDAIDYLISKGFTANIIA